MKCVEVYEALLGLRSFAPPDSRGRLSLRGYAEGGWRYKVMAENSFWEHVEIKLVSG